MSAELESLAEFLTGNRLSIALPWQLLRGEDLRVLREWASETMPVASQRRLMRELREALRQPVEAEDEVPRPSIMSSLLRAGRRSSPGSPLAPRQAKLLLEACQAGRSTEALRDAAVISLMLLAGLRRKEVVELQRGDYDDDEGRLRVSSHGRTRSVMLEGCARTAVGAWLQHRGGWPGPLVAALDSRGEVQMRGIAPTTVNGLLAKRARQSGCEGITPRDLRGRFLWQLQSTSRERPRCRYYQDENGQPAWVLASMASI